MKKQMKALVMTRLVCVVISVVASADNALPLGDGKIVQQPTVGYVYRCGPSLGNGARMLPGPWIQGQYWYPEQKPSVQGNVSWPSARISVELSGSERVISTNALPNHATGI